MTSIHSSNVTLTGLYNQLNVANAHPNQELRSNGESLYLKKGAKIFHNAHTREQHRHMAFNQVVEAMISEYNIERKDALGLLKNIKAEKTASTKITAADIKAVQQQLSSGEALRKIEQAKEHEACTQYARSNGLPLPMNTQSHLYTHIQKNYGHDGLNIVEILNPWLDNSSAPLTKTNLEKAVACLSNPDFDHIVRALGMIKISQQSHVDVDSRLTVATELAKLPPNTLKMAERNGLFITLTHDNVTTHLTHLKSQQPRGHGHQSSWENVPGVGGHEFNSREVVIALEKKGNSWEIGRNHGSANLVLHEFAHAIDRVIGNGQPNSEHSSCSQDVSFRRAWSEDRGLNRLASYYRQSHNQDNYRAGLEESFAEAVARHYGGNRNSIWNTEAEVHKLIDSSN